MSKARLALVGAACAGAAMALAPGCKNATQVTVDVRYARTTCGELHGTSVTVGVEPLDTEDHVKKGYVSGTTSDCDATGRIGTLVVTPGDAGHGSIVVLVASTKVSDPSQCPAPLYPGCIVARRSFAFVDHEGLYLPVTISPDCLDVPCDAFSTCRGGKCFPSDVACDGGTCAEPGALADGGTAPDSGYTPEVVAPPPVDASGDVTTLDGSSDSSGQDAPSDGPAVDGTVDGGGAACDPVTNDLYCPNTTCGGLACCLSSSTGLYCMSSCAGGDTRLCCKGTDCASGLCSRTVTKGPVPIGGNEPGQCL